MIRAVRRKSLGEYLGLQPSDRILSLSGVRLSDELDFMFYASQEKVLMEVLKQDGKVESFEIEKDPYDLMGIEFSDPLFDGVRVCQNDCSFCFLKQLPKGLRRGLYVRDDDFRLSFLFGNFITLTNFTEGDYVRIKEQRLSPLRVSCHTTDGVLREKLLGNKRAGNIMGDLKRLTSSGINLHIQIVLLRDVNDGHALEKTLRDLFGLGERIVSVGVVPAIYTKYMKSPPSRVPDASWARSVLDLIESFAENARRLRGKSWVFGADEFYFLAGKSVPDAQMYDGFPQYQNGIGMVADFRQEMREQEPVQRSHGDHGYKRSLLVTGKMAEGEMANCISELGLDESVVLLSIKNRFFGDNVTCSGLLTGQDILTEVLSYTRKNSCVSRVLLPDICISDKGEFIDGFTVESLSSALGVPVLALDATPKGLLGAFSG